MAPIKDFTIKIPANTVDWGKTLITSLNAVFSGIVKVIHDDTSKLSNEFSEFKRDVLQSAKDATDMATKALETANTNTLAIADIRKELIVLKHKNDNLNNENMKLKQQTNMLESYSRRNNLVIRGIAELDGGESTCEELAKKFFIDNMKLDKERVDKMRFVRCHRMGRVTPTPTNRLSSSRPIIVRFCEFSDRQCVWDARTNLSNTQHSINENFSQDVEYNRRKLYPIYKLAKKSEAYQNKVSLRGDVLIVNSREFTVDNLDELPDELHPRQLCFKSNNTTHAFGGLYSEYCCFSNWSYAKFSYENTEFTSSEQAYFHTMAIKSKDNESAVKILATRSPREAKYLGGEITGFNVHSWNKVKGDIMQDILRCKFTQNAALRKELLNSGDKKLVEGGNSTYFAAGLPLTNKNIFDSSKYPGKNKLGEFLQVLRNELVL